MFELYEDNAGGLHMYAVDRDGRAYWGEHYAADDAGAAYRATVDWSAWVVYDDRDATIDDGDKLVASTQWAGLLVYSFDWNICGARGLECAEELGIIERCPECGEIVERCYVPSAGALKSPATCPVCGAALC